jgi:hypothetical protein
MDKMRSELPSVNFPSADRDIEQALDRLGASMAPVADENEFISRVMQRIGEPPAPRRTPWPQRLARLMVAAATCVIVAIVFWRTAAVHKQAPDVVASKPHKEKTTTVHSPVDAEPAVRTSTWSTVSESVVLENDVPVRKLLYREFERVELVDANGNTESQMVVPTKAMLLATKEYY